MLHIMSENEKCLSYSLEVNQFTDSTQEECESTYLGYKPQDASKLVTTLDDSTTMVAFWIIQVIGIGLRAVSRC